MITKIKTLAIDPIYHLLRNKNFRNNQNYILDYKKSKNYVSLIISNWFTKNKKYWYTYFSIKNWLIGNKWIFTIMFIFFWFLWIIAGFEIYENPLLKILISFIILLGIYIFLYIFRLFYNIIICTNLVRCVESFHKIHYV